jgi:hypothetical protein
VLGSFGSVCGTTEPLLAPEPGLLLPFEARFFPLLLWCETPTPTPTAIAMTAARPTSEPIIYGRQIHQVAIRLGGNIRSTCAYQKSLSTFLANGEVYHRRMRDSDQSLSRGWNMHRGKPCRWGRTWWGYRGRRECWKERACERLTGDHTVTPSRPSLGMPGSAVVATRQINFIVHKPYFI